MTPYLERGEIACFFLDGTANSVGFGTSDLGSLAKHFPFDSSETMGANGTPLAPLHHTAAVILGILCARLGRCHALELKRNNRRVGNSTRALLSGRVLVLDAGSQPNILSFMLS